jgi:hypothetical protein
MAKETKKFSLFISLADVAWVVLLASISVCTIFVVGSAMADLIFYYAQNLGCCT